MTETDARHHLQQYHQQLAETYLEENPDQLDQAQSTVKRAFKQLFSHTERPDPAHKGIQHDYTERSITQQFGIRYSPGGFTAMLGHNTGQTAEEKEEEISYLLDGHTPDDLEPILQPYEERDQLVEELASHAEQNGGIDQLDTDTVETVIEDTYDQEGWEEYVESIIEARRTELKHTASALLDELGVNGDKAEEALEEFSENLDNVTAVVEDALHSRKDELYGNT